MNPFQILKKLCFTETLTSVRSVLVNVLRRNAYALYPSKVYKTAFLRDSEGAVIKKPPDRRCMDLLECLPVKTVTNKNLRYDIWFQRLHLLACLHSKDILAILKGTSHGTLDDALEIANDDSIMLIK